MERTLEQTTMRRVTLCIISFVMLLYFISFSGRVNIGFSSLEMNTALGLLLTQGPKPWMM